MTLTDFLLARIADDEERATFVQREVAAGRGPETFEAWRLSWQDEYDILCIEPERALAECEAKRRIVEFYADREVSVALANGSGVEVYAAESIERCLHFLALPYAAHPDYDPDWRP